MLPEILVKMMNLVESSLGSLMKVEVMVVYGLRCSAGLCYHGSIIHQSGVSV